MNGMVAGPPGERTPSRAGTASAQCSKKGVDRSGPSDRGAETPSLARRSPPLGALRSPTGGSPPARHRRPRLREPALGGTGNVLHQAVHILRRRRRLEEAQVVVRAAVETPVEADTAGAGRGLRECLQGHSAARRFAMSSLSTASRRPCRHAKPWRAGHGVAKNHTAAPEVPQPFELVVAMPRSP